jgi:lipopolysaccharide biosynthesis regulator YciM
MATKKVPSTKIPARAHYRCKCGLRYEAHKIACPSCGKISKKIYRTK